MHFKSALAIFLLLGSSLPALSSESDLQAAFNQKMELYNKVVECETMLARWQVENVTGPQLLNTLKKARENQVDRKDVGQLGADLKMMEERRDELEQRTSKMRMDSYNAVDSTTEAWELMDKELRACDEGDQEACAKAENLRFNVYDVRMERASQLSDAVSRMEQELAQMKSRIETAKQTIQEAKVAQEEVESARRSVAELLNQGYQLNQESSVGLASYHVLENQCEDLSRRYVEAHEQYWNLLEASKKQEEESAEDAGGDRAEDVRKEEAPPLDQVPVEPSVEGEFEDTGEFEYEQVAEDSNAQDNGDCARLLAEFNAAPTLDAQRGILQQATDCSWFGQGFAALVIEEIRQNPQGLQSVPEPLQQVQPGALGTVVPNPYPNPFPNPYAQPPLPWQPPGLQNLPDIDHYSTPDSPPKQPPNQPSQHGTKRPTKKPSKKPSKKPPQKPNYSGGGEVWGY